MSDSFDNTGVMGRPWFKPLVGAWFALLLGGGLWLMPPHVHAWIARSTNLSNLHPMFAPPVSATGVAVLCGIVALFGLLLGVAIAARLAAATAPRAFAPGFEMQDDTGWQDESDAEAFEQPRRRRVFSAREDIGEEGIAISAASDADYELEYTLVEDPPATPEQDFEAVYAEMDETYQPGGEDLDDEAETDSAATDYEFAEFEEVDPEPETATGEDDPYIAVEDAHEEMTEEPAAMGDMSLDALLGRLEGALEAHKSMVARSEEAARRPAPEPIPITREFPDDDAGEEDGGLPEASEDDPVIAFLRREASRRMPAPGDQRRHGEEADEEHGADEFPQQSQTDAQAALRSALDRLGQVNRRD